MDESSSGLEELEELEDEDVEGCELLVLEQAVQAVSVSTSDSAVMTASSLKDLMVLDLRIFAVMAG